ncbi:MAG: 50S ribosomal protein L17 [Parcubacteria group bacterium]|nr:50S ribosomal protein L17 [Parcubacteria group bacterium]
MKHLHKGRILKRTTPHRKMLLRNLATSLVLYEKIKTTRAKAKEIRPIIERYVTKSRSNDIATRRQLLRFFTDKNAVKKMLEVIGPRYAKRNGGYTRIMNMGQRRGDAAKVSVIQFV